MVFEISNRLKLLTKLDIITKHLIEDIIYTETEKLPFSTRTRNCNNTLLVNLSKLVKENILNEGLQFSLNAQQNNLQNIIVLYVRSYCITKYLLAQQLELGL